MTSLDLSCGLAQPWILRCRAVRTWPILYICIYGVPQSFSLWRQSRMSLRLPCRGLAPPFGFTCSEAPSSLFE